MGFLKHIKLKVKGRAIYLVIFLSFISAVILLLFISSSYYIQVETLNYEYLQKLIRTNNSLIQYSLQFQDEAEIPIADLDIELEDIDAQGNKSKWGGFNLVNSRAQWRKREYTKAALTGPYLFDEERIGLYLADKGKYLSIAGETKLSGSCYLPALGIRSVYIDGKPYKGKQLVYGKEKKSKEGLPPINEGLLNYMNLAFNQQLGDTVGDIGDIYTKKEIFQSFKKGTLLYKTTGAVELEGIYLSGRIVIQSDSMIVVKRSLQAENIILVAKQMIIEKGFSGSLQAFVSDSLLIESDVTLEYPSFVSVYNPAGSGSFCFVEEDAEISGGLLCSAELDNGEGSVLFIEEGAVVNGIVYSGGNTTISGNIYGSLYAGLFVLKTPRGYYENHIFNTVVDPQNQYEEIIVPDIVEGNKNGIVEWLE